MCLFNNKIYIFFFQNIYYFLNKKNLEKLMNDLNELPKIDEKPKLYGSKLHNAVIEFNSSKILSNP